MAGRAGCSVQHTVAHLAMRFVSATYLPACLPAVRGLLLDSRKTPAGSHMPAVAEGLLAVRPGAGAGAGGSGAEHQARHRAGLAAAAGQQAAVAMLCLERLISLGGLVGGQNCGETADLSLDGEVTLPASRSPPMGSRLGRGLLKRSCRRCPRALCHPPWLYPFPSPCSCLQQSRGACGAAGAHWRPAGEAVQAGAGE